MGYVRLITVLPPILILTACVGDMTKGLSPLVGMPASVAFDKLGFPTDERMIAGRKVYIWSKSQIVSSGGDVGEFKCTVRIFVDASETITSSDWSGNLGGCASYMRRLGV